MLLRYLSFLSLVALLYVDAVIAAPVPGCGDQSKVPAAQRLKNTPKWSTASEEDSFGYDVYRGEAEKGPFTKLTKSPVLGAGTTNETHSYQFVDDTINPCKEYWYYVESISTQGTREKFTPIFKAPAKLSADGKPVAAAPAAKPADGVDKNVPGASKH